MVSRLLYEKHIYDALDDNMKDIWGVHICFSEIEDGSRMVFGCFSKDTQAFLGCAHGKIEDGYFVAHLLFKRKTKALQACFLIEETLKEYCKKSNIQLLGIKGYPAEKNLPAVNLIKKIGCVDTGILDNVFFCNGNAVPCKIMIKEY